MQHARLQRPCSTLWRGLARLNRPSRLRPISRLGRSSAQPRCFLNLGALVGGGGSGESGRRSPLSSLDEEVAAPAAGAPGERMLDRDEYKEASRRYFRTTFDHERWAAHRSTSRYVRHVLGMPHSRMVRGLARPLFYVLGVATAVAAYESALQAGLLPSAFPDLELHSTATFGLTSFALSLLLVFRTNASYSRWLDARKAWGFVLNRSRDLVRQGLTWFPEERSELRAMLCRFTAAFPRALMCHLRVDGDVERELQGVLLPHELTSVLQAEHRPNFILQVLSQTVRAARLDPPAAQRMDENLTLFEDAMGTCERILRTPIPLSYTRHTSRFMMIWLTLLPFTIIDACGWTTVPLCGIIAFLLLGIEEIGVSIEEPHSILPLESICDTALRNVQELQALHARRQAGAGASSSGDAAATPSAFSAVELVELAEGSSSSGGSMASMGSVGEAGMSVWWGRLAPEERMGVSNLAAADDMALPTAEADCEASRRGV